jgi:hypothetical protein
MDRRRSERLLSASIALAALVAVLIQLVLVLGRPDASWRSALRFFSYFTILSNLAVAATSGLPLLAPASRVGRWLAGPRVRGGVALYIAVTGAVYALLLAHLWQPQGAQWLANALLHYVVPVAYVGGWLVFAPHARLTFADALRWLSFPAAYLAWVLVKGAWLGEYPYPFLDLATLGVARFAISCAGLFAFFLVLGLGLVAADRKLGRRASAA